MRLVDADKLIAELQKDEAQFDKEAEDARNDPSYTEGYSDSMWSRANGIRDAIIEIYDAPSIDIVRCSECVYCNVQNTKYLYAICERHGIAFKPFEDDTRTHGCAWGKQTERSE